MKALKRTYYYLAVIPVICFISCKSETTCITEEQKAKTNIVSISGPDHVNIGEQATITIGVMNNTSLCVKEATADISNAGYDTLMVTAGLHYTNDAPAEDCNCKTDSIIYTLIYFKPLDAGTYRIITKIDSNVSTSVPEKLVDYSITVD